jgi:segregation and condensation protein B
VESNEQRRIVEALILASHDPITPARLAQIVPGCTPAQAKDLVNELNTDYQEQDRAFEVWEVAGGYQIRTRAEFSGYLHQLRKERPLRLSRAALEALSIIAYKQPVTRAEIDMVRGVDTGAVIRGLMERRLVRIVGHREVPGRPLLYGTNKRFLEVFGLGSLEQLPSLRELEELAREQGLELPEGLVETDEISEETDDAEATLMDAAEGDEDAVVSEELIEADLAARPSEDAAAHSDVAGASDAAVEADAESADSVDDEPLDDEGAEEPI